MNKKMDVLVDLQFGSTGKGALAGYLSEANDYDAIISANMPNAGHTAYCPDTGQQFIHKVLPSGIFGESLRIVGIGPGAVFFPDRLRQEWYDLCTYRKDLMLVIHEASVVARESHKTAEAESLSRISSTMQGSAEAMISKIRRQDDAIAKNHSSMLMGMLGMAGDVAIVTQAQWLSIFDDTYGILVEGSQGYSLGTSAGFYPYCTSRDCTVARVISDCSLPVKWLNEVYGCARVHPIRVGNTPDGYSGDWYPDQHEITFDELGVPEEKTTVTQRVRRIATFSTGQMVEAMMMAMPNHVFLNFFQYDQTASIAAQEAINSIARELGCGGVHFIGWGPNPTDIEEA